MALPILNAAKYSTIIPSTGKEIQYRPYLVKEEKILMVAMESKDQKQIINALKDVIKTCIYDEINVSKLTMFDLETLFIKLRGKSVGEKTEVKVKCLECDAENLQEINFDDIKDPVVTKKDNRVQLTDDVGVILRYPTVSGMEKQNPKDSSVEQAMIMIMDSIESIYDSENVYSAADESKKELKDFVDSLNSTQFKKLTAFFEDMPALTYNLEFDCVKCGHHNKIELRGMDNFFG
jgi:hypothetical protein